MSADPQRILAAVAAQLRPGAPELDVPTDAFDQVEPLMAEARCGFVGSIDMTDQLSRFWVRPDQNYGSFGTLGISE